MQSAPPHRAMADLLAYLNRCSEARQEKRDRPWRFACFGVSCLLRASLEVIPRDIAFHSVVLEAHRAGAFHFVNRITLRTVRGSGVGDLVVLDHDVASGRLNIK